jgi:hypothetical protein
MTLPDVMDGFVLVRNIVLPLTTLTALILFLRRPGLGWLCLGVWATALALVLFLPLRVASYTPSSFDDNAGGIGIFVEWVCFSVLAGVGHAAFCLLLLRAALARGSAPRPSPAATPTGASGTDFSRLPRYRGGR